MAFKLQSLAELCRQLRYTPRAKRLEQLASAEELLLKIDPDQAYPPAFVLQGVTGYRSREADVKSVAGGSQLAGVALQHDLGLLCETVSGESNLAVDDTSLQGEPVLDLAAACDRFGVTSKTLQRWRRKGLPARRLVFADGKQRVGFRLSCAERFFATHDAASATPGSAHAAAVNVEESARLVERARCLAAAGHDRREIVLRVAKAADRTTLATRSAIEAADAELLAACPEPLAGDAICARLNAGEAVGTLATELGRPRSAVYRAAVVARADRLAAATVKYHDDDLFHGDPEEAERQVNALVAAASSSLGSSDVERVAPPRGLPPYLADLYRTPLLTPTQERAGFLSYNFHKCRFAEMRRRLDPHLCRRRDLTRMERHLRLAREARNRLLTANLRLVVHVARKHLKPGREGVELMDLVSEGNVILMRAVEGFDVARGFKFSTYATLALMKGFARGVVELQTDRQAIGGEPSSLLESACNDAGPEGVACRDEIDVLLDTLGSRERKVLCSRWGLFDGGMAVEPDALAERMGVSRRRLRQIEAEALDKLRQAAGVST